MLRSVTGLLALLVLFASVSSLQAQTDDVDTTLYSERGWMMGVGFYGAYAPVASTDLDRVFAEDGGFADHRIIPFSITSRIVLGWPSYQLGFTFETGFPASEEMTTGSTTRRVKSEVNGAEVSLGYPLRFGESPFSMVPSLGLGGRIVEVDMTETTGEDSFFGDEETTILFAQEGRSLDLNPHVVLDVRASQRLHIQAIGGIRVPIFSTWETTTGEEVEPGTDLEVSPMFRLGVMMNLVDRLYRP